MKRYALKNILGEARIFICNYIIAYFPSHWLRLWYYKNIMKYVIEDGASIHIGCKFACTKHFYLGKNSTINQNCHLDNRGGIMIKENVSVASRCALITADHLMDSSIFEGRNREIILEDLTFMGYGATVLGGVILTKGSVLGACSLAIKNTEAYGIYVGVPAKKIRSRSRNLSYTTSYRRLFH
jgi:acetyltransferase-like isoleucine patch superfamily enzyme